jgi:hypothetical protein
METATKQDAPGETGHLSAGVSTNNSNTMPE